MSVITKEIAAQKLSSYLDAETKVLQGQRYKIQDRELERASLNEIRAGIEYWRKKYDSLNGKRRGAKVFRVIPRDL